jgi:DNA adenine methylase
MKAPFPWFGGKSRVSNLVWERFGNTSNYVEPFFGSGAVLLNRPHDPLNETVNDKDCYVANFWRACQQDPEQLAHRADWPVNEADLHARHLWLVNRTDFQERMKTDPDYFDPKIAGWWVWGISQWIGSGWCSRPEWRGRHACDRNPRGIHRKLPKIEQQMIRKSPQLKRGNNGVHRQIPDISGDSGASGRGVFAEYANDLDGYMVSLSKRLRRVRICCGDWKRILGPSPTTCIGITAVFLDPPYSAERSAVYNEEDFSISADVRHWALDHGSNPDLRIALCGYAGEHEMPADWECVAWKANGGYGNQSGDTRGKNNATLERIWFSPHCLRPQSSLFAEVSA